MLRVNISKSRKFSSLTPDSQRLFVMLIPHLNSYGKMEGQPEFIKGKCVPLLKDMNIKKIENCLAEISIKTSIKWFEHEDLRYLHCLNWENHQEFRDGKRGYDDLPAYSSTITGIVQEHSRVRTDINKEVEVEVEVEVKDKVEVEGIAGGETSSHFSNPKKFQKPNETEVKAYAKSIDFELDGSAFCDFYESKGWMIGKTPMNDWKAAVRTWKRSRTSEFNKPKEKKYEERWAPKGTSEIQGSTSGF